MADKPYPVPESGVVVLKDKIYHNDKLIAELHYLGNRDSSIGLAIFYYQHNKEVWIFPKEGWNLTNLEENKTYSTIPEINEPRIQPRSATKGAATSIGFLKPRHFLGLLLIRDSIIAICLSVILLKSV
ncbi:MAG: hypothetical protein HY893_02515, partial [Deltaproteobacteria bacterium]|nr:hypothetical protein [Deltaproteobacteria bacterium]